MQAEQQSERERFEAWHGGLYRGHQEEIAYAAWQARAALSTPHQAVQDLIKARDTFGWSPEVDEKINALRPLSTQPQQAGWISVNNRLPKPWEDVLIHPRPTDYCCEGHVDHKGQWFYGEYVEHCGHENRPIKPTHWMPLPPVPGQEGGAHADQA